MPIHTPYGAIRLEIERNASSTRPKPYEVGAVVPGRPVSLNVMTKVAAFIAMGAGCVCLMIFALDVAFRL